MSTRKIKNGDMYLKDDNQIIIVHGNRPAQDTGADRYITAVFGDKYSGNFGTGSDEKALLGIQNGDERYTYIGNLSDIFRKIL